MPFKELNIEIKENKLNKNSIIILSNNVLNIL
jgi:hypothetical protein